MYSHDESEGSDGVETDDNDYDNADNGSGPIRELCRIVYISSGEQQNKPRQEYIPQATREDYFVVHYSKLSRFYHFAVVMHREMHHLSTPMEMQLPRPKEIKWVHKQDSNCF